MHFRNVNTGVGRPTYVHPTKIAPGTRIRVCALSEASGKFLRVFPRRSRCFTRKLLLLSQGRGEGRVEKPLRKQYNYCRNKQRWRRGDVVLDSTPAHKFTRTKIEFFIQTRLYIIADRVVWLPTHQAVCSYFRDKDASVFQQTMSSNGMQKPSEKHISKST